ncbi:hypothetical protein [Brevundimonas sp.]|nr:hypothetical protein [Brevundimonas sp.]
MIARLIRNRRGVRRPMLLNARGIAWSFFTIAAAFALAILGTATP